MDGGSTVGSYFDVHGDTEERPVEMKGKENPREETTPTRTWSPVLKTPGKKTGELY